MEDSKIILGIDVSRNRSGGAKAHIIGILKEFNKKFLSEIEEVHIWGYPELIDKLPKEKWLVKHKPKLLKKSILHQLYWQYFLLPKEAKYCGVDIMLNTDAGTISPFQPSITMSRDMLSYEKGEINRYGFSFQKLRLYLLRYIQNRSLTRSSASIFLTKYASTIIQSYSGDICEYKIIPHGVSDDFRLNRVNNLRLSLQDNKPIKCVYVSNVDLYKHQWNVAKAISILRERGLNISCTFIGGGKGTAQKYFEKIVGSLENHEQYLVQLPFVSHDKLPSLLRNSDIFIFASSCENMPNTLIEGMCTGLPIACSNRGPMPEVLNDGGVFFDPENIVSISDAIMELIIDDTRRRELAQRSFLLSEQYNWKRCSNETFNYIIKIFKSLK